MISQNKEIIGGKEFIHTFSDTYTIIQVETNKEYSEAWDTTPCKYTYKESNNLLKKELDDLLNEIE